MKARIKLRLGDMFDGPSDLIILPCSTSGTITNFVARHLRNFNIPYPKPGMALGDVNIIPFEGAENIAQYVAFAASVKGYSSDPLAIEKIGENIGKFSDTNSSVRIIAAPLLGAGAGGLKSETVVKSIHKGFITYAPPEATLTISILHKNVFEQVRENLEDLLYPLPASKKTVEKEIKINKPPLRVFISYTSANPTNKEWVKTLATFLRKNGIDARLDIWHLRHGMDLPQWMCNELQLADRVILVSDETYAQKANGRHGGVGWETMIIQGDISRLPPESTKFIAIIRSDNYEEGLPFYLRTKYCIHWHDDANDDELKKTLIKELCNKVEDEIPELGKLSPIYI